MTSPTDSDAFDRQFAAAADRLLLFIRLRLGRALAVHVDELDVLQDVYVAAHRAFAGFEGQGEATFMGWLCTIASRQLANHGREKARGRVDAVGCRGAERPLSRVLELARDARTGPLTAAVRVDAREALARAIDALEPEPREVLLAHFFEGRSQVQIAKATGQSSSAVQRSLASALVAVGRPLRDALGDGGLR